MNRKSFLALGLILIVGLAAGVIWATGDAVPVEKQEPVELPDTELPGESVPADEAGICGPSLPTCNSGSCNGPGCQQALPDSPVDLGVRCCSNNGQFFECPAGQTVHRATFACGTGGVGFCEKTGGAHVYCN